MKLKSLNKYLSFFIIFCSFQILFADDQIDIWNKTEKDKPANSSENKENIKINNIKIDNQNIFFNVSNNNKQSVLDIFQDENSDLNPYYPRFKSHQLEIEDTGLNLKVNFSRQGLIKLKTSSQDQAIEIVRRRVDEVGTNEPNILKRGNNRILVELPGLDDPMRIKSLLIAFQYQLRLLYQTFLHLLYLK